MKPYRFSPAAKSTPPITSNTRLIDRMNNAELPTHETEHRLLYRMYRPGGYGTTYRYLGWSWDIATCRHMKPWFVSIGGDDPRTLYAVRWGTLVDVFTEIGGDDDEDHYHVNWIVPFTPVYENS